MTIDDKLVDEILQRLLRVARPQRVILFGSAASGQMTPDRDIDLLVVEPDCCNSRDEAVRLRSALRGLGFPVDVIVMAAGRFEETKNVIGGIAYPAHKYGKVVYEAA